MSGSIQTSALADRAPSIVATFFQCPICMSPYGVSSKTDDQSAAGDSVSDTVLPITVRNSSQGTMTEASAVTSHGNESRHIGSAVRGPHATATLASLGVFQP